MVVRLLEQLLGLSHPLVEFVHLRDLIESHLLRVPISGQRESFFQSRDETEKKFPPISGIETRSRFIIFTLRLRDENENSLDLISFFETRPRILKLAIFP